ncbi:hypothetical protein HOLleu_23042 [Holothuria leucospilota]|uniref:Uncharacterized protein n=1 Tax=Holothuria leucospilota TaxID=206669 RepID=A0A9Q1BUK9_HOLLE|nr:hypothetical protein HOLleu_23042 [Holothuria leucospilota]
MSSPSSITCYHHQSLSAMSESASLSAPCSALPHCLGPKSASTSGSASSSAPQPPSLLKT